MPDTDLSRSEAFGTVEPDAYRAAFAAATDAQILSDARGVIVDANAAACAWFGLRKEDLAGRPRSEVLPELASIGFPSGVAGASAHGELLLVRADGAEREVRWSAVEVMLGLQLITLRAGREHDVSEPTLRGPTASAGETVAGASPDPAESASRASEARFRAMVENGAEVIWLVGERGNVLYASPSTERILGHAPSYVLGRQAIAYVFEEDVARVSSATSQLVREPLLGRVLEFRVRHRQGGVRWVEATVSNLTADPAVSAFVWNFRDVSERKATEAALRESQRALADAQRVAHLGSWEATGWGLDMRISWSVECARIFGRDPSEAPKPMEFLQMVHPDDRGWVIEANERGRREGRPVETEHRIVQPSGAVRWVYSRSLQDRLPGDASGHVAGDDTSLIRRTVGVVQDITERRLIEDTLRASEARYRRIVENTSEGVWLYSASGETTFMNPRMAEMLGTTVEFAVGRPVVTFMDEEGREQARARFARRKLGMSDRQEVRLTRADGSDLWVSSHSDPLFDAAGNFEGAQALVSDVTERRRADELRSRLAAIVESSDDAIISFGVDGTIRTWNRGAERLTQYAESEAVGKPIAMLDAPDQPRRLSSDRPALGGAPPPEHYETVAVRKDGSRVDISVASSVIADDAGRAIGTSIIARNISGRISAEAALRRSEEQLRQAQKLEAIGSLAGGIAHDFNNLLSVVLSYTSMMLDDLNPSDPLRIDIGEVHKAGLRATDLTRQLLAFSRQQVLQPVVLDLNVVVANMESMLGRLLREDIALSITTAPLIGKVHADPGQIEQVVMNLVVNARDAMPDGGSLNIATADLVLDERSATKHARHPGVPDGSYVVLTVEDTGTGMDAATKQRIFEPFFTTKDKSKGTGLGLATVYGIVQQSGGHITVHTELGQGTTFMVYLPRTERVAEPALSALPESPTLRGQETVLLVEDEEQVRVIMATILRKHGYHVLEAQNAGEALLVCEQFAGIIHLMLTDVVMPRMSGRQLAERLAPMRPQMLVLYVSGYTDDLMVHHGVAGAGIEFLQKPITPSALVRKVRQVLDGQVRRTVLPDR